MARRTKKGAAAPETSTELAPREYSEEERASIGRYLERVKKQLDKVKCERRKGVPNSYVIHYKGRDELLSSARFAETFGTPDRSLQDLLLNQLILTFGGFVKGGSVNSEKMEQFTNIVLALLGGIRPQDEVEAMLVVQMIAVHNVAVETLKRAMVDGQTLVWTEASVNQATKMLRTYTAQMEALKRYRTGGQQRVVVEHVNVSEGGQAIVGAVTTGGGVNDGKRG